MARKARKSIPLLTKLAASLLSLRDESGHPLISYEESKTLSAQQIVSRFDFDHWPILHAHGGPDEPWNLRPMLRPEHKEKSRRDTSIAAKVKRLRAKWWEEADRTLGARAWETVQRLANAADRQMACQAPTEARGKPNGRTHPKRRIPQRAHPWPSRGSRPFRGRPVP